PLQVKGAGPGVRLDTCRTQSHRAKGPDRAVDPAWNQLDRFSVSLFGAFKTFGQEKSLLLRVLYRKRGPGTHPSKNKPRWTKAGSRNRRGAGYRPLALIKARIAESPSPPIRPFRG